jgi:polysaccharide biosynthesis transport protein
MVYHSAFAEPAGGGAARAEPEEARGFDLRRFWPPLYRSRWAILAIFVAMLSLAVVATLLMTPVYRAAATIEVREEARKVLGNEDENERDATSAQSPELFLQTQLNIMRSRSTIEAVARSLNLYTDDRFFDAMHAEAPEESSRILTPREVRKQAVEALLRRNLDVEFAKNTRIAQIEFDSPDPRLASRIANSFAENYIRMNLERRFDASRYSLQFLRDQIKVAQARLGESERAAIAYARSSRLVDASNAAQTGTSLDASPRSLTTASLVQLNQAYSEAVARRLGAQQRWAQAQGTRALDTSEVMASPVVQQLFVQRAQVQSQLRQQLQTRSEDHPVVQQLRGQLTELDRQLNAAAGNLRGTIRSDFQTAQRQEAALLARIERLKTSTLNEQDRSIRLSILQREANTNRAQLGALLTRYNDLNAQSGVQTNNLSVIDDADVPTRPVWPKVPLNIALALLLAAILSALFVVGREHLFEVVRTPEDVTGRLHVPSLGALPVTEDVLRAAQDAKSDLSEALSTIRTSLALAAPGGVPPRLMVTSTEAGEGKSTTLYGLAVGLGRLGKRVVVIDADLRRPNIHRLFALPNTRGLGNVLAADATLDEVVQRNLLPGVDAIVGGPVPPSPTELLSAERLSAVVADLAQRYDHVLVDSAPVLGLADAPLVAQSVDGIVFVIESARVSVRGASNALDRLRQTGKPILGAVLSRFDASQQGYSYDYKYEYDYSYADGTR